MPARAAPPRPSDARPHGAAQGDVAALLAQMLDETRRQTAIMEESRDLLRRIWHGDAAQLSRADIAQVLGVSTSRVDEMISDGIIPTYRLPGRGQKGHQRVGWDTLKAIIRSWAR